MDCTNNLRDVGAINKSDPASTSVDTEKIEKGKPIEDVLKTKTRSSVFSITLWALVGVAGLLATVWVKLDEKIEKKYDKEDGIRLEEKIDRHYEIIVKILEKKKVFFIQQLYPNFKYKKYFKTNVRN